MLYLQITFSYLVLCLQSDHYLYVRVRIINNSSKIISAFFFWQVLWEKLKNLCSTSALYWSQNVTTPREFLVLFIWILKQHLKAEFGNINKKSKVFLMKNGNSIGYFNLRVSKRCSFKYISNQYVQQSTKNFINWLIYNL